MTQQLLIITQKLDANDYVFGFFFGHIIDLADGGIAVTVLCLETGDLAGLPASVRVVCLGKGETRWRRLRSFYRFLWFDRQLDYDSVLVHMEPLYLVLAGWWWRLTGRRVWLWYNHVYHDWKLVVGSLFAHTIIGVSSQGVPVRHRDVRFVSYSEDLKKILTSS